MNLRGTVVNSEEVRTVTTRYGDRDLAEVSVRPDDAADPVTITLWGKWTETAAILEPGMDLVVTDVQTDEFDGTQQYATTKESYAIVEPEYLVDVTDIRQWVQCPRLYYLNKLSGVPLAYPVVKGTIVHEVFGDLLRERDLDAAVADAVADAGLELGLLGRSAEAVEREVSQHARAIEGWLQQGTLTDADEWRSEYTLISERFGIKGRCDAIRRGMPVELKTGKNTARDPRFEDKVQAACYALLLAERDVSDADTGTLLYTKNAALDRTDESGDLSPAKEFSIGRGLLDFVVRARNAIAAMEFDVGVPTGYEGDATCEYCFEQDTCMVVSGRLDQESKAGRIGTAVPDEEREYFDRQYRLIEEERRAVHRDYTALWRHDAEERAANDNAIIDLEPIGRRQLDDGRWELRARATGAVSRIREGDLVLVSEGHPVQGHAEPARVERLDDEVIVTADEPVALRRLDVYPSEFGADRMLTALYDFVLKSDDRRTDVLFGRADPTFDDSADDAGTYVPNNETQDRAVARSLAADDFALVHGPPGTGKTYTIARIVEALIADGQRVLLSAFTNRAVDNALEALRDRGIDEFVRIGTESGVRDDMQDARLRRRGDPGARAGELEDASVVAATTSACGSRIMRTRSFDVAIVDEASQLTEPETLAAINRAERFVLVGDHHQLPPVVRAENDLSQSLFERLIDEHPDAAVALDRQYRMAQRIQAFPSREFYDGLLRPASTEVAAQRIDDLPDVSLDALPDSFHDPVVFLDPDGRREANTNPVEAARVVEVVEHFLASGVSPEAIGVIAPFRAQVAEITHHAPDEVTVDTVDRFQGSSKEVIVVSFVATDSIEGPIFEDYRRVNVALTRAKKTLVLVGDETALRTDDVYARMVDWADR